VLIRIQLKVIVGEGLNRNEWHSVVVRIDVHGARLIARVDNMTEEVYLKGLNHDTNYGVSTNLPSVVLVGGNIDNIRLKIIFYKDNFNLLRFKFRRKASWCKIHH
jgi:Laminin G domain